MEAPSIAAPCVLVVTADRELERRVHEVLAGLPYSVITTSDSSEARALLVGANPPDIALFDHAGHGETGLEAAAAIKSACRQKLTWMVLLMHGEADPDTVASAADAGIDDVLLCPANDPVSELDLRVRLGVGTRVQALTRQLEEQAQAVSFHSLHDGLTGVWNRESLLSLLFSETDRVQRLGTPLTLMLLDLDNFSQVNAEYGYASGDRILQEFVNRLRRYLRSYDLLGRSGEDEFLIALPGCTLHQARHLAARIRNLLLHRPFIAGEGSVSLTVSIGLAQSRGRSPLVVLREAERALARAKQEGRNCEREYLAPVMVSQTA